MTSGCRQYLIQQSISSAIFNFFLNGAIAWLAFRSVEIVPLRGPQSILGDTIAMAFLLPFLVCLIVTAITRRATRNGSLPTIEWVNHEHIFLSRLPDGNLVRSIVVGLACTIVVVPYATGVLFLLSISGLHFWSFFLFKSTLAASLAAIVTPVVALRAIADSIQGHKNN